jgi:hypothetical protein
MPVLSTRGGGSAKGFGLTAGAGAVSIEYLIIAGGGAGGCDDGGGGGSGGFRQGLVEVGKNTVITLTVGGGAPGSPTGNRGDNSVMSGTGFTTLTSTGGGQGAGEQSGQFPAYSGGSGGGGGAFNAQSGGQATMSLAPTDYSPIVTTPSGFGGNAGGSNAQAGAAGGGSSGAVSASPGGTEGGTGAAGKTFTSVTSSAPLGQAAAGGGGRGRGGTGGGGAGGGGSAPGQAGDTNTGSGGGGTFDGVSTSGSGGSGFITLIVPTAKYSSTTTGSPTVSTSGAYTILKYTGSGSYTA